MPSLQGGTTRSGSTSTQPGTPASTQPPKPPPAPGSGVSNVRFVPASPARLQNGDRVSVRFDYTTAQADGVRIGAVPFTGGARTPYAEWTGYSEYGTGSGEGNAFFTVRHGNLVVDQVRFQITTIDRSRVLHESTVSVEFAYGSTLIEDCLSFDPAVLRVEGTGNNSLLTNGGRTLKRFDSTIDARDALKIIQHYGINRQCFVGRRDAPSLEYWLVGDKAPAGPIGDEDCVAFDQGRLGIRPRAEGWVLLSEGRVLHALPSQEEAKQTLSVIANHSFNHACFIGRFKRSMIYFRQ